MQKEILISDQRSLDEFCTAINHLLLKMNEAQVIKGICLNGIKIKVGVAFETDETIFDLESIDLHRTIERLNKMPSGLTKNQFWDAIELPPFEKQ